MSSLTSFNWRFIYLFWRFLCCLPVLYFNGGDMIKWKIKTLNFGHCTHSFVVKPFFKCWYAECFKLACAFPICFWMKDSNIFQVDAILIAISVYKRYTKICWILKNTASKMKMSNAVPLRMDKTTISFYYFNEVVSIADVFIHSLDEIHMRN